jgi:hypothetical protein
MGVAAMRQDCNYQLDTMEIGYLKTFLYNGHVLCRVREFCNFFYLGLMLAC